MGLRTTNNAEDPEEVDVSTDVFLVSDLHLADGQTEPFGKFRQGENFFWDESFKRFLETIASESNGNSQTLVIDGDFLDFLRVDHIPRRSVPQDQALVLRWASFLAAIEHPAASTDLYAADPSEQEYGFKTQDFKSVWKVILIADGHRRFFDSLRDFLAGKDNRLYVVKGNHDLELRWEATRQALVYELAEEDVNQYNVFNERVKFFQQSVVLNGMVYIEHGHRFSNLTYCTPETLDNKTELLLPVGSLFNRYVINKIEAIEPLFDNIKPPTKILEAVALHFPTRLLNIIVIHCVGAWRIVKKKHAKYAAAIIGKIIAVGLPLFVFLGLATFLYFRLQSAITDDVGRWALNTVVSLVGAIAVRGIQKKLGNVDASESLASHANTIAHEQPSLRMIVFGHTHTSEMTSLEHGCWYVNSGTWIPNIEIETNRVEDTNTFCVLRLVNKLGILQPEPLLRWNDGTKELERILMFETREDGPLSNT